MSVPRTREAVLATVARLFPGEDSAGGSPARTPGSSRRFRVVGDPRQRW